MRNLVSIIMPAYNGDQYISKAIDSVLAQTYQEWELVVVDDGSTDRTAAIVQSYPDARIRYFYQENRGQTASLNRGLDLVNGEYVTTLDVDDWLTEDSLQERVRFLNRHHKYGAVYGDSNYCDADGRFLRSASDNGMGCISGDVFDILISTPFYGTGASVLIRREVIEEHKIRYDESIVWCQDYDFYIRISECVPFGCVTATSVWYRLHDAGMTMSMPWEKRLESLIRVMYKVLDSRRFDDVEPNYRYSFFRVMLTEYLFDRPSEQKRVFEHSKFRELRYRERGKLLRNVGSDYVAQFSNLAFARECLRRAWRMDPLGPKTVLALASTEISPVLASHLIRSFRTTREYGKSPSPPSVLTARAS